MNNKYATWSKISKSPLVVNDAVYWGDLKIPYNVFIGLLVRRGLPGHTPNTMSDSWNDIIDIAHVAHSVNKTAYYVPRNNFEVAYNYLKQFYNDDGYDKKLHVNENIINILQLQKVQKPLRYIDNEQSPF